MEKTTSSDVMWQLIMSFDSDFKAKEIYTKAKVTKKYTYRYLANLVKVGILEKADERYTLIKPSRETPRFKKNGELFIPNCREDHMWRTIRMLSGSFDVETLARHASTDEITVSKEQARAYCWALAEVKILRKTENAQHKIKYFLINDIGGKPPLVRRVVTVFDPNSYQTLYPKGAKL